ncbi:acyl-CoA dehydrogenase family protein [Streptomyces sp. NPDC003327]
MSTPRKSSKRAAIRTTPPEPAADAVRWPRVTRELADDLAVDAAARDRAGKSPSDEVARLQEAGLPALLTPPHADGRGAELRAACAVVREISAADSSIGELLAHHYLLSWSGRLFGRPAPGTGSVADPSGLDTRTAERHWLLAGGIEAPTGESGPGLALTPTEDGWLLHGRRSFASGVTVADRLVVGARPAGTGDLLVLLVDPGGPGVLTDAGAERVGQRLSGAGTVTFDHVRVPAADVLGTLPHDEHAAAPFSTLAPLALRLLLVQVGLGIAEGALAEARDVSRAGQAAGPGTAEGSPGEGAPAAGDDPYLLLAYGELATAVHAAAAVAERATDALERGLAAGWDLGAEERADIAVLVSAAETVTGRAAVHLTTRVLELVDGAEDGGGRVRGAGPGFDRFWRNARALTAHTRPSHRLRDIGDHYLNGTHSRLTLLA